MEQAKAAVSPVAKPIGQFPPGSGAFLMLATCGALAWLVMSMVFADTSQPSDLRRIDGLWGWVILAMFQILLEGKSAALRSMAASAILAGVMLSLIRYTWTPEWNLLRATFALTEAAMVTLAVIITALRGMTHLSGRAVKAADVWMFIAMQWLLVWAAAFLVLTWRNWGEPPMEMRQKLVEMLLFGAGVHTMLGLALSYMPGPLAGMRDRASLAALVAYDAGLILLMLLGWPWWTCMLMFAGILLFLLGASTLLKSESLLPPLLLFCGCMFIASATLLRPIDLVMFAGWRHAISGGCVGLGVLIALGISAGAGLPEKYQARGVIVVGAVLFMIGVTTRLCSEISDTSNLGVSKMAIAGSGLEIFALAMVGIAAMRGRGLRRRMGV